MTDAEADQRIADLIQQTEEANAEREKQMKLANVGAQYGNTGFYRNLNPSEKAIGESPPPGGFTPQNWSTFGNISGADTAAEKTALPIGSGNIETLYDPLQIT